MKIIVVTTARGDRVVAGLGLGQSETKASTRMSSTQSSKSGNVLLEQGKNV